MNLLTIRVLWFTQMGSPVCIILILQSSLRVFISFTSIILQVLFKMQLSSFLTVDLPPLCARFHAFMSIETWLQAMNLRNWQCGQDVVCDLVGEFIGRKGERIFILGNGKMQLNLFTEEHTDNMVDILFIRLTFAQVTQMSMMLQQCLQVLGVRDRMPELLQVRGGKAETRCCLKG